LSVKVTPDTMMLVSILTFRRLQRSTLDHQSIVREHYREAAGGGAQLPGQSLLGGRPVNFNTRRTLERDPLFSVLPRRRADT